VRLGGVLRGDFLIQGDLRNINTSPPAKQHEASDDRSVILESLVLLRRFFVGSTDDRSYGGKELDRSRITSGFCGDFPDCVNFGPDNRGWMRRDEDAFGMPGSKRLARTKGSY
jgi:hypothetical protein